jgi:hypothetical protein
MKIILRIVFLLLSITCWVFAFLPPGDEGASPERTIAPTPASPTATPAPANALVTDLLGGQQIRAGQKAREQLDGVNAQREAELKELE